MGWTGMRLGEQTLLSKPFTLSYESMEASPSLLRTPEPKLDYPIFLIDIFSSPLRALISSTYHLTSYRLMMSCQYGSRRSQIWLDRSLLRGEGCSISLTSAVNSYEYLDSSISRYQHTFASLKRYQAVPPYTFEQSSSDPASRMVMPMLKSSAAPLPNPSLIIGFLLCLSSHSSGAMKNLSTFLLRVGVFRWFPGHDTPVSTFKYPSSLTSIFSGLISPMAILRPLRTFSTLTMVQKRYSSSCSLKGRRMCERLTIQ